MRIAHRTLAAGGRRSRRCGRIDLSARGAIALALALLASLGAAPAAGTGSTAMQPGAGAMGSHAIPTQSYYNHFGLLYEGAYSDALEQFRLELSNGVKTSQSRWIDSICYYTMMGECCYRMGRLGDALDNYNAAVKLYLAFPNWMQQVQFPPSIGPRQNKQNIPWGHSGRGVKLGNIPSTMLIAQGQLYIDQQLQQGGVITPPSLTPIDVQEIVRCTALAIKRRGEIMGPVCPQDKLTEDIAVVLGRHPGPANWSEAWVDLELGMAYVAAGQPAQAIPRLKQSQLVAGAFDHPLTGMALMQLGQIALDSNDYPSALQYFEEASYSAVEYDDIGTLEEAFRYGQQAHLMANKPGIFPPLNAAIGWARTRNHELWVSLLLLAAENNALLNQTAPAAAALTQAKTAVANRTIGKKGDIASRLHYLTALLSFQMGKVTAGDQEIEQAILLQRDASKWLFQIWLADFYVEGQAGPRLGSHRALKLYETLLVDPTPRDWASRPMESLAVLGTPHAATFEHWFENALDSGVELGLEVADRTRRHRFYSTLPLGGRLLSLRWVLEAPPDALDQRSQMQRQNLLAHYPKYEELSKQVRNLRAELASAPLVADTVAAQRKQADALAEIGKLSTEQELILREIALRREAADMVFPPMYNTKDVQASLPPRTLMLIFFTTASGTHAWLISKERYADWKIDSSRGALEGKIGALLKAMGNFDATREIQQSQLGDDTWRQASRDLTDLLLANSKASGTKVNLSDKIDELIIVPDGVLWYLPFESLQISASGANAKNKAHDAKDFVPLITKTRIRYLPTMGLAMPERLNHKSSEQVGVVLGKLHPKDDAGLAQTEFDQMHAVLPNASAIKGALPAASPLYGSLFDALVVFDDIASGKKGAYEWSPVQLDRSDSAGALSQWFTLPWKSPLQMILPGFHTPAETSLRGAASGTAGNEMFLTVCGLMSTGTRTVLISRWRTGGQSSYELVRQFIQELPFAGAADAWQRSVQMMMETPVDFNRETRVKATPTMGPMTAHHPFFWSGYMLVDTGWTPPKPEKPLVVPPVINLNAKAVGPAPAAAQKN